MTKTHAGYCLRDDFGSNGENRQVGRGVAEMNGVLHSQS